MPWLLNVIYCLLIAAVAPILLYRRLVHGKYRTGWNQKLWGLLPLRRSDRPLIWLHAVSVGEVLQLQTVVQELQCRLSGWDFLITTTTSTGYAVAKREFPAFQVCYFPLDFSWTCRRALSRVQPDAVALVELEIWPNFISAVHRAGIPLFLINGRVSEHSYRGYKLLRPLLKRLLSRFDLLAAQNETYADRLTALGADSRNVHVTGSVKFDRVETDRSNERTTQLRKSLMIDSDMPVFVAGSTQAPEEEYAIDAWLAVRETHPRLRLVIAPRHQERFEEVASLISSRGLPLVRRSAASGVATEPHDQGKSGPSAGGSELELPPVILLDTLGELGSCWGLADVAFVGGSLTQRGGQNMIEPAGFGAAILFGPNTWNFQEVTDALIAQRAAKVVANGQELQSVLCDFLNDTVLANEMGDVARRYVLSQQGASRKTAELLYARLVAPGGRTQSAA